MKNYIAVDLGGTNIRVGLVNEKLDILSNMKEKSIHRDAEALYLQIKRMVKATLSLTYEGEKVTYLGISAAGFCEGGILKFSPNLQIHNFDLAGMLNRDFPDVISTLANDANCSALMEAIHGSTKDYEDSFFFTVSSGIGCGLIYQRKLIDLPFEVGHNYIGYQNRFWEIEQLCSGNGIVNLAKLNGLEIPDSAALFSMVATSSSSSSVVKVYNDWLRLFGSTIANVQLTYNPDAIILSGGVMQSKKIFWEDLRSVAQAFVAPFPVKKINLVSAAFEQETGLMGGLAVAMQQEKLDSAK